MKTSQIPYTQIRFIWLYFSYNFEIHKLKWVEHINHLYTECIVYLALKYSLISLEVKKYI